jgi:hypothetical protein
MRVTKMFFTIACLLGLIASGFAQNVSKKTPGILGYLDPTTGTFRMLPSPETENTEAPLTVTTGKFVISYTITISSALASTAKIACIATASLADATTGNFITEEAGVLATKSGTTATCTVTIPYSWNLGSPSSDKVTLTYSIQAPVEATASTQFPQRLSTQSIGTIAVPANGATTNETVTATI